MLNATETRKILHVFTWECYEFWANELHTDDDSKVWSKVIADLEQTKHDPYSTQGEELDVETREEFITQLKNDLEI